MTRRRSELASHPRARSIPRFEKLEIFRFLAKDIAARRRHRPASVRPRPGRDFQPNWQCPEPQVNEWIAIRIRAMHGRRQIVASRNVIGVQKVRIADRRQNPVAASAIGLRSGTWSRRPNNVSKLRDTFLLRKAIAFAQRVLMENRIDTSSNSAMRIAPLAAPGRAGSRA